MQHVAIIYVFSIQCSLSASCTHVSAVLHSLVALTSKGSPIQPTLPAASVDEGDGLMPVTSYLCQWKVPKKRKESKLQMSAAVFEKHDYRKEKKRKVVSTEDFDPRPAEFRGKAPVLLQEFLEKVRGQSLGVSVMFDPQYRQETIPTSGPDIPNTSALKETVRAFKESLCMPTEKLREIEQNTREQRDSPLWQEVRRYRITASRFGEIVHRRDDTPPDRLVLSILEPRSFSTPATQWGIQKESLAIQEYQKFQHKHGLDALTVGPCGFLISESHPYLGATPDGTVYDPSNIGQPFGFLEVKCPFSQRDSTPVQACASSNFCCDLVSHADGSQRLRLRKENRYYAQVQGQMAVGGRPWCDFVVFTNKGISVERVSFDEQYWDNTILPALENFYDHCLGPEIVSPLHAIGIRVRNLSK